MEVLVLDEADTLLDMGFKESVNQILALLPKQRRTGLFSATQTKEVKNLARAGLRNPVSVCVRVSRTDSGAQLSKQIATPSTLENNYVVCEHDRRPGGLVRFIQSHIADKIIVFCATCACVDYFSMVFNKLARKDNLLPSTLLVLGFHGRMEHKKRTLLYKKFVAAEAGVLFSTDVAARGVDIPDVDWIVQLAAPKDPAFFVHRVGRTARAGRRGGALLFVSKEEESYINLLRGRGVPMSRIELVPGEDANGPSGDNDDDNSDSDSNDDLNGEDETEGGGDEEEEGRDEKIEEEEEEDDKEEEEEQSKVAKQADELGGDCVDSKDSKRTTQPLPKRTSAPAPDSVEGIVLSAMKGLAVEDRSVLEAGSTAFMAFLRAYQEHLCSYIFRSALAANNGIFYNH